MTQAIHLEPANPAFADRIDARQPPQGPAPRYTLANIQGMYLPGQLWVAVDAYDRVFAHAWEVERERDEARAERDMAREAMSGHAETGPVTRRMLENLRAELDTAKRALAMANDVAATARDETERVRAELDAAKAASLHGIDARERLEAVEERHAALVGAVMAAAALAQGEGT